MSQVTATVRDPNGNLYINAKVEAIFIPFSGATQLSLASGSVFPTFTVNTTDSFGVVSMSVTGNDLITPAGSQWRFSVISSTTPTVGFSVSITISGSTQDISATLQAAAAPLPLTTFGSLSASSLTVTGAITAQSFQGTVELDHFTDMAAAVAALPSGGTVHVPCGNYNLPTTAVAINVNGIHIRGEGFCSNLQITSATNDSFAITAAVFQVYGVQLTTTTTSSRNGKAIFHSTSGGGSQLRFENIRWTPAVGPDSGSFFIADVNGTSQLGFRNISVVGGSTQPITSFVKVASGGPSSVSVIALDNIWGAATCTDACIVLDGFIDTFKMDDVLWSQVGGSCLGPQFWARNTVGSGTNPRWMFSNNVQFECPGGTAIKLDASREFQYVNSYVATSAIGIAIGANATETKIAHSMLTNIATNGITVNAGAVDTLIFNNTFTDCGNGAANTTDCISVAANTVRFAINHNFFRAATTQHRDSINILAGTSTDFEMIGNNGTGAFGTLLINNGATGVNQHILGNVPLQPVGTEILTNPLTFGAAVTCQNVIQAAGGNFAINCVSNTITAYNSFAKDASHNGAPFTIKSATQTAQAANIAGTNLVASAVAGRYRLSCYIAVTQQATTTATVPDCNLICTDPTDSVAKTIQVTPAIAGVAANPATSVAINGAGICDAKVATAIQYSTTNYASSGATPMQYKIYAVLESL